MSHRPQRWLGAVSPATLSLLVLVVQNSTLVVITRHSKVNPHVTGDYYTSTLILNQEVLKMILCLMIYFFEQRHSGGLVASGRQLAKHVCQCDTLKLSVPALLFTIQNSLIFLALSNIDALSFQVLSQAKLLSAAVFSVWLLGKRLKWQQWVSLLILVLGVFVMQVAQTTPRTEGAPPGLVAAARAMVKPPLKEILSGPEHQGGLCTDQENGAKGKLCRSKRSLALARRGRLLEAASPVPHSVGGSVGIGALACVVSGLSSSFAGVYFEKVVKTTAPSLAIRNIHLSIFGIPFAAISMLALDALPAWSRGDDFEYWRGYNTLLTWCLVVIHALGGLLVAVVVKYADNILKSFATGMAVVLSGILSFFLWGYIPTLGFVAGCILVVASTVLYHTYDVLPQGIRQPQKKSSSPVESPTVISIGGSISTGQWVRAEARL